MRWPGGIVAACATLAIAPAATGAVPIAADPSGPPTVVTTLPVRMTGGLFVQFHGDPAAGCARWGLCGYSGTVSWRPTRSDALQVVRTGGRHPQVVALLIPPLGAGTEFSIGVTTANVEHAESGSGAVSDCADVSDVNPDIVAARHGRVTVSLTETLPSLLATRCAGPRDADVLPHLPVRTLPLAAIQRGSTQISLATVHALHAHGLTGTITSTIALHLGRPGAPRTERNSGPRGPSDLGRLVEVGYRATLSGSIAELVRGAADPLQCAPLGSCASTGTITLTTHAHTRLAHLVVVAHATTPRRQVLAAAGLAPAGPGGTGRVTGTGSIAWRGGTVRSDVAQGADSCRDVGPEGRFGLLLVTSGHRLRVRMSESGAFPPPLLATRCPGPMPPSGLIAGATAPLSALDHRTTRFALTRGSATQDDGYQVRFVPHLTLTLTRLRVRTRRLRLLSGAFFGG